MSIKNGRLTWAEWRPLGPQTEPEIHPEVLIFHTIVGGIQGAENLFKAQGYTGDESTFGLGGPWDGADLDGVMWQWQDTRREADAQVAGNPIANSVETSDGGHPNHPWSSKQLKSLIRLAVDFCVAHPERRPHLVNATGPLGDGAYGYHELRAEWNPDFHGCPGVVREAQLRTIVIPKARAILNKEEEPPAPRPKPHGQDIDVDGIFGADTVGALQRVLHRAGFYDEKVDGIFGPQTRAGLQEYLKDLGYYHGRIDSIVGVITVKALKAYIGHLGYKHIGLTGAPAGHWGHGLTTGLQRALNKGRF